MLRPIDIQNKEFEKKLKGYNCDEVENTMQKSIDIAKQAAEDAKRNAETEANAIISKAKLDASYLARQIDDEHMKRHQEMLSLKGEIEQYKMQIKSLCANVMKMVDNID